MPTRADLLLSIAARITDYRPGELGFPLDQDHVDHWVSQFDPEHQITILYEIDHVFKSMYFNKEAVVAWLRRFIHKFGDKVKGFRFLNIQDYGTSQNNLLTLLGGLLLESGIEIEQCGGPGTPYIYLDDCIFTGRKVVGDLRKHLDELDDGSTVWVLTLAAHTGGLWNIKQASKRYFAAKRLDIRHQQEHEVENRLAKAKVSQVLWPVEAPNDLYVQAYCSHLESLGRPPQFRGQSTVPPHPFSSESNRQVLESQFFKKGAMLFAACQKPDRLMRPLGYHNLDVVGFGSLFVTYHNAPNNGPLVLWWGNPNAPFGHPFRQWYPLLPRRTYQGD